MFPNEDNADRGWSLEKPAPAIPGDETVEDLVELEDEPMPASSLDTAGRSAPHNMSSDHRQATGKWPKYKGRRR